MRIAVCDDDSFFLARAAALLELWGDGRPDVAFELFSDGDALLGAHNANAFDIILLDIMMPLADGIEVARELRAFDEEVKIVFLTSSNEFACESYAVKADNYLLKNTDPSALLRCLDELERQTREKGQRAISIKGAWTVHHVRLASVEYLEAHNKTVRIVLSDGGVIESTEKFRTLEEKFTLADGFFKCHRSYLVNINHIGSYSPGEIVMRTGQKIPIARSHQADFKEAYFSVIFGKVDEAW